jgi:DNA recombination protein RmuC
MEPLLIGLVVLVFLVNIAVLFVLFSRKPEKGSGEGLTLIQQQLAELGRTVDERLDRSTKTLHESVQKQMSESYRLVKDVTEGLVKLEETNKNVLGFTDQLQNLQDILKNPKQRGILGEYYLETLLKNVMPPGAYQMQYAFENGEIVDAAVFIQKKIIPVDSKFSLENYNRFVALPLGSPERLAVEKTFVNDLKMRIQETAKYIRPGEGTMDFAFMFIPSEGIYYDLLTNSVGGEGDESLIQRAASKYKVIIVSPTSFLAYLQTVMQGLKALQIEEQAKDIQKRVGELGKHLGAYDEYMVKLGNSLQTTVNHYNTASKEIKLIDKDVMRITGDSPEIETVTIEGPER